MTFDMRGQRLLVEEGGAGSWVRRWMWRRLREGKDRLQMVHANEGDGTSGLIKG
jgi:hypothetical protein